MPRVEPSADVAADARLGKGTVVWHLAQVRVSGPELDGRSRRLRRLRRSATTESRKTVSWLRSEASSQLRLGLLCWWARADCHGLWQDYADDGYVWHREGASELSPKRHLQTLGGPAWLSALLYGILPAASAVTASSAFVLLISFVLHGSKAHVDVSSNV